MAYNVALILPLSVYDLAVACSEELSRRFPARFCLGQHGPFPHVTLYSFVQTCGPTRIKKALQELRLVGGGITCEIQGAEHHDGYVGIQLGLTEMLLNFHWEVVNGLKGFAEKLVPTVENGFSSIQFENATTYGYPDVGGAYNPHITITRLQSAEDADAAVQFLNDRWQQGTRFQPPAMGLFTSGDHGTCVRLVESYYLSSNDF